MPEGVGDAAQPQPEGENNELDEILTAIAEEVSQHSAGVCAGLCAEFAARMDFVRKTLPRDQAAGALAQTVRSVADLDVVSDWLAEPDPRPLVLDAKVNPTICAEWLAEAFRGG